MDALLDWLDHDRANFWTVALSGTLLWACTLTFNRPGRERTTWTLWLLASVVLLLVWRWPYLLGPAILNPDEAQMIAGAITLKVHPVFWKYVDGTTHGPLTDLPLLLANFVGVPLNYSGARFVGGVLILGGFALAGGGLMLIYPSRAVRLGLAPVMFLWATVAYYDFAGYTSEQASIFLILTSTWPLLAGIVQREISPRRRMLRLAVGGFLLGCVPYAKLQGVPPGVALGALAVAALLGERTTSWRTRFTLIAACMGGAFAPSLLVGLYLWVWGLGRQFWGSYVINNLLYGSAPGMSWPTLLTKLWDFMDAAPGFQGVIAIVGGTFAVSVAYLARPPKTRRPWPWLAPERRSRWRRLRPHWRGFSPTGGRLLGAVAVLAVASIYAAIGGHRLFGHYLQYVGIPLGLGGAVICGELWLQLRRMPPPHERFATGLLLFLCIVPLSLVRHVRMDPDMFGLWTRNHGEWRSPASRAIAALARPGDSLSVWGWMPSFYVETGLPQATREAHTYRQIEVGPMREFYRARFLRDFLNRKPRLFVDAVGGKNFNYDESHTDCAHESFPELDATIQREYVFVKEVEGSRIYLRK